MVAKDCSFCGREGILIYPVRYAIACPAGAEKAPALTGNFQITDAPTEVAEAKYTLRAVRTGYLYTYDEKRGRLKAYIVTPQGYLVNFPYQEPPPVLRPGPMACTNPVDAILSMCIDIKHSDKDPAGVLWIGWSNTAWTQELIKKIKDSEWRRKHMRDIDIPWMLTGLRDRHVGEFEKSYKSVSHFSMKDEEMEKAFGFSNTSISHEKGRMSKAVEIMRVMKLQDPVKKGFIVAVDDPVGITNDLSELTIPTSHSGFNIEMYRGKVVEEVIQSAEKAVRDHARKEFDFDDSQRKVDDKNPSADGVSYSDMKEIFSVIKAGGPVKLAKRKEHERKKYGEDKSAQRKAAEDRAWEELTIADGQPILDAKKRANFTALYQAALKDFEKKAIAFAEVHVEWLKSEQLGRWMDGVHDRNNVASGFAYRESLGQCIGSAAATLACDKQLTQWLSTADVENARNLYARAMVFNQTGIIDATAAHVKGGDVKLKNILSIYKQGVDRLKNGEEIRLVDKLIYISTNSMLKALTQNINKAMRKLVLVNLTLLGKSEIIESNKSIYEIRRWIIEETKKRGIKFEASIAETRSRSLQVAKKIQNEVAGMPGVCAFELDMAQLEKDGRITPGAVKMVNIPGYTITSNWLTSSKDFNIGSVAVVLQLAAFAFAVRDLKKGDKFETTVYAEKLALAIMSLSGSFLELVGGVMEKAPQHPLSTAINSHWAQGDNVGSKTLALGKRASVVAGLLTAVLDFYLGYKSFSDGEYILGSLYLASGVLGASLAIASFI